MIAKVMENLYVGPESDILSGDVWQLKPKVIVTVAEGYTHFTPPPEFKAIPVYRFRIRDVGEEQTEMFRDAVKTILEHLLKGDLVFVHCIGGMSRSPITCICVLRTITGCSWADCEAKVVQAHPPAKQLNRQLLEMTARGWD